jgi:hypothetical protein
MRFAYYQRLSAGEQRIYRESDRVTEIPLAKEAPWATSVAALAAALESGRRLQTQEAAQALTDSLTRALGVPSLRVSVLERRPSWSSGELHGLYRPGEGGRDQVKLWMRTARRVQVVKFRTFLRTLLHELCHHLDYQLLRLEESFHTEGFYKRESSLLRQLLPAERRSDPTPTEEAPPVRRRLASLLDGLEIAGE